MKITRISSITQYNEYLKYLYAKNKDDSIDYELLDLVLEDFERRNNIKRIPNNKKVIKKITLNIDEAIFNKLKKLKYFNDIKYTDFIVEAIKEKLKRDITS